MPSCGCSPLKGFRDVGTKADISIVNCDPYSKTVMLTLFVTLGTDALSTVSEGSTSFLFFFSLCEILFVL